MTSSRRVVVKVGTYLLTGRDTPLDLGRIKEIARQICALKRQGREVVLVSSGAIGAGVLELGLKRRPRDLPGLQAAAAVGQSSLMRFYHDCFVTEGYSVGQILLSREDLHHRERHLNVRHTIRQLLAQGVIPIINENDSVAVEAIKFGDNDLLAALVASLIEAGVLVLLTDVDGLLRVGASGLELLEEVNRITPEIMGLVGSDSKELSRGGMKSKLEAAGIVTRSGGAMVIANGRRSRVLEDIFSGEKVGTFFPPAAVRRSRRKCWIGFCRVRKGAVTVDKGARRALLEGGKSLLAGGVIGVEGSFKSGEMVEVKDREGDEIGRGLVNYSSADLDMIKGKRSDQFQAILGSACYDEVIHRDNLLVL